MKLTQKKSKKVEKEFQFLVQTEAWLIFYARTCAIKLFFVVNCLLVIDIKRLKINCLRFVMCPLLAPGFQGFYFLFFLMQPLTVLMKQTR
jgi:hypothetical protein